MDLAVHTKHSVTRHEWLIGPDDQTEMTARTFEDGIFQAKRDMEAMGIDLSYDDSYYVRAGDQAQIILFVDVKGPAGE